MCDDSFRRYSDVTGEGGRGGTSWAFNRGAALPGADGLGARGNEITELSAISTQGTYEAVLCRNQILFCRVF